MLFLLTLILGLVQGAAELLPVSSSGHLAILQNLFGLAEPGESYLLLNVMLHIGTLAAVCLSMRNNLKSMVIETSEYIRNEDRPSRIPTPVRLAMLVGAATLPLIIALPFYRSIARLFSSSGFVGVMLIINGVILYTADRMIQKGEKKARTLTLVDAVIIGCAQLIALVPGLSRLGATVSVARTRGAEQSFAVRFSLLMSIPAIAGSTVVALFDALSAGIKWSAFPIYLFGMIVAAAAGVFAIRITSRIMKSGSFVVFAYYCAGLGAVVFLVSLFV